MCQKRFLRGQAVGNYSDETFLPQNLWILPLTTILSVPKTMAGVGHVKRICKDAFSVAAVVQDRSGRWFPERGCILEHQIFRFAKIILRDRCSTSYDPVSLFHGRRSTLDRWTGKIAKRSGTRPSALHSTFHFGRKCRRIASFLMLSTKKMRKSRRISSFLTLSSAKIEEVSLTCCVFDVVKFKNWGILAE